MLPWDSTDQESKRRSVLNRLTLHEVLQHAWCCGEAAPLTADLLARRTAVADTADLFAALEARDVHCSPSEAAQVATRTHTSGGRGAGEAVPTRSIIELRTNRAPWIE